MLSKRLKSIKRRTRINLWEKRNNTRRQLHKAKETEKNDFTVYIRRENTVAGTNVDWIPLSGIYGFSFQIEMKCVAFVRRLSCTEQQARKREQQDKDVISRFISAF